MVDVIYVEVIFIGLGRDLRGFSVLAEYLIEALHTCTDRITPTHAQADWAKQ